MTQTAAQSLVASLSTHGVDRVFAVMADGRGFAWHQVNEEIKK